MLADAEGVRDSTSKFYLVLRSPALMLLLTVLAVNFLGDGLRDAFDPQSQALMAAGRPGALGARPRRSTSQTDDGVVHAVDDVSFDLVAARDARHRGRVGLGQDRHVDGDPRAAAEDGERHAARSMFGGENLARPVGEAAAAGARRTASR